MKKISKIILGVVAFYAFATMVGFEGDITQTGLKLLCLLVIIKGIFENLKQ